jgi:hypothetical protein
MDVAVMARTISTSYGNSRRRFARRNGLIVSLDTIRGGHAGGIKWRRLLRANELATT